MADRNMGGGGRRGGLRAFTLVELLVVIAILALLVSILLPSLHDARQQAKAVTCLSRCRVLGQGLELYLNQFNHYPAHQWRLEYPPDARVRWFDSLAHLLGGLEVQSCPAVSDWTVGRNNSYGYNYKYLGSARECTHHSNPRPPYERFPVLQVRNPAATIAFGDCDGTGWKLDYAGAPLGDGQDMYRYGNHGYTLDPTYIPTWSEHTTSGGTPERYAWHDWRTYLSDRHLGKARATFVDGHGEAVDPRDAYRDNKMWNGLGIEPGTDPDHPFHRQDPHVEYKHLDGGWRYQ